MNAQKHSTSTKSIKLIVLALALFAGGTSNSRSQVAVGSRVRAGKIVAWGSNELGQFNAPSGNDFVAIDAGQGYHCLVLRADGSLDGTLGGNGSIAIQVNNRGRVVPMRQIFRMRTGGNSGLGQPGGSVDTDFGELSLTSAIPRHFSGQ